MYKRQVDALVSMDFMSEAAARNWCEKAVEPYTISIEDFAKRVKSYIERKGNNHHVVFLVDEIGQYIGDDSKLMLNLQTVTEELGKECMGKAWVIAVSYTHLDVYKRQPPRNALTRSPTSSITWTNPSPTLPACLCIFWPSWPGSM